MFERHAAAAADGLDASECEELLAGFQAIYERDDSILVARFNVAAIHESCGQAEQAEAIYAELTSREFPSALNNLGVIAWDRGEHQRAFELFERAVAADGTHAVSSRNNLAMALRERYAVSHAAGDFEQAERHLQNILAVDSSNKTAYENLARLYYDRGLNDGSYLLLADLVITQAQRILEVQGQQSGDLHNLRGLVLMESNDQVRALRSFRRAVEVEPDHVDAHRNIAMIALRFRDYQSAEQSLESVLEFDSVANDVEAWIALGVAKRGLRKYDDAEKAYRQAMTLDVGDPRPWYNLGILAQEHRSGLAEDADGVTAAYELALTHYRPSSSGLGRRRVGVMRSPTPRTGSSWSKTRSTRSRRIGSSRSSTSGCACSRPSSGRKRSSGCESSRRNPSAPGNWPASDESAFTPEESG